MPSFVTPARRQRDDSSDEEENGVATPPSTSSSGRKRPRTEHTSTSAPRQAPLINGHATNGVSKAPTEHQPGSIVRVKLENFVTYDFGEFFPGPSLNMVIGPNGNGKSTLVCAICLGLGWGPQHLGRAKDISEFVKHGAHEASIEIELKGDGRKYKRNPVIRCIIKREGNKTLWTLNGKQSNRKLCMEVAKSFSIQIDNLCQFLPQDRVSEFAGMTPVELLRSTQRAVASQEMIDWHEKLIDLRKKQRVIEQDNATDREHLVNLEGRQRTQEADVQRLREREEVKERIRLLEAVRPIIEYRAKREEFKALQEQRKATEAELKSLEKRVEPLLRSVNQKQAYRDAIQAARDDRVKAVNSVERKATAGIDKVGTLEKKVDEIGRQKDAERTGAKSSKTDIKRLDGVIANLQRQLEQGAGDFDVSACNEQMREKDRGIRALVEEATKIKEELDTTNEKIKEGTTRIGQAEREIKNLDSQAGQKGQTLKRANEDTYRAWQWIQEHQDQFEKPIFGPPVVECSVKDPKYTDLIETLVQGGDMITFTAQTKNDQKKLHRILKQELLCLRTNTRCALDMRRFQVPMDNASMRALGFDGWALDFLSGPEPVLAMLCEASGLHKTGVVFQDTSGEQYERISNSSVTQWVTGKCLYRITRRREYGPDAVSTTVRDIRKAQIWTDQPVDVSAKRELRQSIEEWQLEVDDLNKQLQDGNSTLATLKDKRNTLMEEQNILKVEKEAKQKAAQSFNSLPIRIAQNEEKRNDCQKIIDSVKVKWEELNTQQNGVRLQKAQAALDYADLVEELRKVHEALQEADVMLIEAESDVETLTRDNATVKTELETKRKEFDQIKREAAITKERANKIAQAVAKLKDEADPALSDFMSTVNQEQTMQQLEDDIDAEKTRLEMIHGGDANVISQYEQRERQITKLRDKLKNVDVAMQEIADAIDLIRTRWEPKLDKLVKQISSSFSYNMAQINCNGEVGIYKAEDFENWAIHIQVRFRENEVMARLDSQRQSGGERAVSTVFYLMSLQSLTRSPFRVVDEINQGMDPRNERLVHSRMVAIATGNDDWVPEANPSDTATNQPGGAAEDVADVVRQVEEGIERADLGTASGSQYFLVTPKLLHDLRYEEGMRVMCIVSGEHLPSRDRDIQEISFKRSLEIRKRLNRAAVAAG